MDILEVFKINFHQRVRLIFLLLRISNMRELFHFLGKIKKKAGKNPPNYYSFKVLFLQTLLANPLSYKELANT